MSFAGSVLFCAYLLFKPLVRKLLPSFRRNILLLVCALFLVPFALFFAPAKPTMANANEFANTLDEGLRTAAPTAPVYRMGQALSTELTTQNESEIAPATKRTKATPVQWILIIYAAGIFIFATVNYVKYNSLMRLLRKNCTSVQNSQQTDKFKAICAELNITKKISLWESEKISTPLLVGILRPVIILPKGSVGMQKLEYALRHELTHDKNNDLLCKLLMLVCSAVHWYNPLTYVLLREFDYSCEETCDAAVTAELSIKERTNYAESLLCFADAKMPYTVSAFASPAKRLKKRIICFLRPQKPAKQWRFIGIVVLCTLVCAGLLMGCSVAAGAASTKQSSSVSISTVPKETDSVPATSATLAPKSESKLEETISAEYIYPFSEPVMLSRGFVDEHKGLDFPVSEGTEILAIADGKVIKAEFHYSYGNFVEIEHANGVKSLYAHCKELIAEMGEEVKQGEEIAFVGATGQVTGNVLHLEVYLNDEVQDPLAYIS